MSRVAPSFSNAKKAKPKPFTVNFSATGNATRGVVRPPGVQGDRFGRMLMLGRGKARVVTKPNTKVAAPKPINLPSMKSENYGVDPSVNLVPAAPAEAAPSPAEVAPKEQPPARKTAWANVVTPAGEPPATAGDSYPKIQQKEESQATSTTQQSAPAKPPSFAVLPLRPTAWSEEVGGTSWADDEDEEEAPPPPPPPRRAWGPPPSAAPAPVVSAPAQAPVQAAPPSLATAEDRELLEHQQEIMKRLAAQRAQAKREEEQRLEEERRRRAAEKLRALEAKTAQSQPSITLLQRTTAASATPEAVTAAAPAPVAAAPSLPSAPTAAADTGLLPTPTQQAPSKPVQRGPPSPSLLPAPSSGSRMLYDPQSQSLQPVRDHQLPRQLRPHVRRENGVAAHESHHPTHIQHREQRPPKEKAQAPESREGATDGKPTDQQGQLQTERRPRYQRGERKYEPRPATAPVTTGDEAPVRRDGEKTQRPPRRDQRERPERAERQDRHDKPERQPRRGGRYRDEDAQERPPKGAESQIEKQDQPEQQERHPVQQRPRSERRDRQQRVDGVRQDRQFGRTRDETEPQTQGRPAGKVVHKYVPKIKPAEASSAAAAPPAAPVADVIPGTTVPTSTTTTRTASVEVGEVDTDTLTPPTTAVASSTDFPLTSGVVVIREQSGIEYNDADGEFQAVRSKREILDQRKKEKEQQARQERQQRKVRTRDGKRKQDTDVPVVIGAADSVVPIPAAVHLAANQAAAVVAKAAALAAASTASKPKPVSPPSPPPPPAWGGGAQRSVAPLSLAQIQLEESMRKDEPAAKLVVPDVTGDDRTHRKREHPQQQGKQPRKQLWKPVQSETDQAPAAAEEHEPTRKHERAEARQFAGKRRHKDSEPDTAVSQGEGQAQTAATTPSEKRERREKPQRERRERQPRERKPRERKPRNAPQEPSSTATTVASTAPVASSVVSTVSTVTESVPSRPTTAPTTAARVSSAPLISSTPVAAAAAATTISPSVSTYPSQMAPTWNPDASRQPLGAQQFFAPQFFVRSQQSQPFVMFMNPFMTGSPFAPPTSVPPQSARWKPQPQQYVPKQVQQQQQQQPQRPPSAPQPAPQQPAVQATGVAALNSEADKPTPFQAPSAGTEVQWGAPGAKPFPVPAAQAIARPRRQQHQRAQKEQKEQKEQPPEQVTAEGTDAAQQDGGKEKRPRGKRGRKKHQSATEQGSAGPVAPAPSDASAPAPTPSSAPTPAPAPAPAAASDVTSTAPSSARGRGDKDQRPHVRRGGRGQGQGQKQGQKFKYQPVQRPQTAPDQSSAPTTTPAPVQAPAPAPLPAAPAPAASPSTATSNSPTERQPRARGPRNLRAPRAGAQVYVPKYRPKEQQPQPSQQQQQQPSDTKASQ